MVVAIQISGLRVPLTKVPPHQEIAAPESEPDAPSAIKSDSGDYNKSTSDQLRHDVVHPNGIGCQVQSNSISSNATGTPSPITPKGGESVELSSTTSCTVPLQAVPVLPSVDIVNTSSPQHLSVPAGPPEKRIREVGAIWVRYRGKRARLAPNAAIPIILENDQVVQLVPVSDVIFDHLGLKGQGKSD